MSLDDIVGMPGALPYFAAMSQILKDDFETDSMIWILMYNNSVFALPLINFIVLRIIMGQKTTVLLGKMTDLFQTGAKR